jgi:hypothetical protein
MDDTMLTVKFIEALDHAGAGVRAVVAIQIAGIGISSRVRKSRRKMTLRQSRFWWHHGEALGRNRCEETVAHWHARPSCIARHSDNGVITARRPGFRVAVPLRPCRLSFDGAPAHTGVIRRPRRSFLLCFGVRRCVPGARHVHRLHHLSRDNESSTQQIHGPP